MSLSACAYVRYYLRAGSRKRQATGNGLQVAGKKVKKNIFAIRDHFSHPRLFTPCANHRAPCAGAGAGDAQMKAVGSAMLGTGWRWVVMLGVACILSCDLSSCDHVAVR